MSASRHRRRLSWAWTVRMRRFGPRCGRSMKPSAARLVYAWFMSSAPGTAVWTSAGKFESGAAALRAAHGAIKTTGKPMQFETAIVYGDVGSRLLKESRTADLICAGSVGFGPPAQTRPGPTVAILAKSAPVPGGDHRRRQASVSSPWFLSPPIFSKNPARSSRSRCWRTKNPCM